MKKKFIPRDISWLSFNERVLQEAADTTVPLKERVKFLGIFSNNLDEFFRVRVATLKRMVALGPKMKNTHLEMDASKILDQIQQIVLEQQLLFNKTWEDIRKTMSKNNIFLVDEKKLSKEQQLYVKNFFEEEVRNNTIPLMIESIPQFPYLREKSIYLGVVLSKKDQSAKRKYAIIEIPSNAVGRFVTLPSSPGETAIILLEDVIRFNLSSIFSFFGYDHFESWVFKVTKDAEIELDQDISTDLIQKIEKAIKSRRKGKTVRFVYDKKMDPGLLDYLLRKLNLAHKDSIIPGGRIHNFRHFMDFPDVFAKKSLRKKPFPHPDLKANVRVTDVILKKDILLNFPYQSFDPVIELLRESAIDPDVKSIKITAYRLASNSKIVNALVNAVRNGKDVTVMLELRARFEEEANLKWKERLEEEGVKVLISIPEMKVHAKICSIKKKIGKQIKYYGFVSTGNMNEKTAKIYGDHCILTSNLQVLSDINRVFQYLENWKSGMAPLNACSTIFPCPVGFRKEMMKLIDREIKNAKAKKEAKIILKMNSLADLQLIEKLTIAAIEGVEVKLIIRGIFCMLTENKKYQKSIQAISIVDEYLEHARVFYFYANGEEKMFLSSADWMIRNIDHRVEVTCPVLDNDIKQTLKRILEIQLNDNVKARILNNSLNNMYVQNTGKKKIRSQVDIYQFLMSKALV